MTDHKRKAPAAASLTPEAVAALLQRELLTLSGGRELIRGKRVLVTGGGGSIGSELCRQIAGLAPELLLILDIYENNAYELQQELAAAFPGLEQRVLIASIRDRARLDALFAAHRPQLVFHAAAHKHVPLMEENPSEAVKNNVFGTQNVIECAMAHNTERLVLISTDKAVKPVSIMGASKRLCEMLLQLYQQKSKTVLSAVRFGNVLGSNGSVIPLFQRQLAAGGPLTVTHREAERYFMTIPEAAMLVLQAAAGSTGGEIFALDMGKPVKIYDLARRMISLAGLVPDKDIAIEITGLRPGEKLKEELLLPTEGGIATCHEQIFITTPPLPDKGAVEAALAALWEAAERSDDALIRQTLLRVTSVGF